MTTKTVDINIHALRKEGLKVHDAIIASVTAAARASSITVREIEALEGLQVLGLALYESLASHRHHTKEDKACYEAFQQLSRRLTELLLQHISRNLRTQQTPEGIQ